jgi:hypothetical protein
MPAGLGAEGKALWSSIADVHELAPDAVRILADACGEADLVALMELARGSESFSLIVRGSQGQDVINPLISELRQHRATLASLLKSLKLPMSTSDAQRLERETSEQARSAARARWDRRVNGATG